MGHSVQVMSSWHSCSTSAVFVFIVLIIKKLSVTTRYCHHHYVHHQQHVPAFQHSKKRRKHHCHALEVGGTTKEPLKRFLFSISYILVYLEFQKKRRKHHCHALEEGWTTTEPLKRFLFSCRAGIKTARYSLASRALCKYRCKHWGQIQMLKQMQMIKM